MKEFIVNLDHTTRQQITVLADTEEDAAILVLGMFNSTNALVHLPTVSMRHKIICGDVKLALPTMHINPPLSYNGDDAAPSGDEDEEVDLLALLTDVRDEVEAALEHLDSALFDLSPEDE